MSGDASTSPQLVFLALRLARRSSIRRAKEGSSEHLSLSCRATTRNPGNLARPTDCNLGKQASLSCQQKKSQSKRPSPKFQSVVSGRPEPGRFAAGVVQEMVPEEICPSFALHLAACSSAPHASRSRPASCRIGPRRVPVTCQTYAVS